MLPLKLSQHLVHNELAFSKLTQEGVRPYTPMAVSASLTSDFELTEVVTGMPVPDSPWHILVYPDQTANQRQHTLPIRPSRRLRIRFSPPLNPPQNHPQLDRP